MAKLQKEDAEIQELIRMFKSRKLNGYCLEDGILFKYRKNRTGKRFKQLVVPNKLRKDILELCHDNFTGAHLGQKKTWIKLSNRFFWPNSYNEYKRKPVTYNVGDQERVKLPQTRIGLKKKLRNDLWSEPLKITKLKEANRMCDPDKIRNLVTVTKSGRMSKPRFQIEGVKIYF
ncbi:Transposon Ty3-I Gag-Pol poly [Brachionus plicatilis]|uniref:Transposon Ty3-I Gag-Pol poly n=1 Tax=Brachionus plicatilis TaxID=10195 RepID=A0A3M7QKY8_BRAPC|nr:Transposon Ty3-I Gag-Pol poly [Brachionus plicatilis]